MFVAAGMNNTPHCLPCAVGKSPPHAAVRCGEAGDCALVQAAQEQLLTSSANHDAGGEQGAQAALLGPSTSLHQPITWEESATLNTHPHPLTSCFHWQNCLKHLISATCPW